MPHASVTVALPNAAAIAAVDGLQVNTPAVLIVIVGGVLSCVQVTVDDAVAVLPHASIAVNVLICDRVHPVDWTAPSLDVTIGAPHASVAVALPNAAAIAALEGLQLSTPGAVTVIVGGVMSCVQIIVEEAVAVFPQASVAVNVLTWFLVHPLD